MSTLARILEAHGLATVSLSLVRQMAEQVRPPRALHCNFPLGRPLGRPLDSEFQTKVLLSAFDLLGRPEGPVLEDFPEAVEGGEDQPLTCRIPPANDSSLPPAVAEARGLRAAYERQRASTGRTSLGKVVDAEGVPAAVEALLRLADGVGLADAGLPGSPPDVAMDVRVYYEEAALALVDHVPAARSATAWFFERTEAGRAVLAAREALKGQRLPLTVWYAMAPDVPGSFARYVQEYPL